MLVWIAFVTFVLFLLALDLGVFHRKARVVTVREALVTSAGWIALALVFNAFVYFAYEYHWFGLDLPSGEPDGRTAAVLFLTGYMAEKSLGMDNVFVIAMIFSSFGIPAKHQHRVLFWGIVGALVMRAAMILAGAALIERFHWILYVFGIFLIVTGVRMILAGHALLRARRHRSRPGRWHHLVDRLGPADAGVSPRGGAGPARIARPAVTRGRS